MDGQWTQNVCAISESSASQHGSLRCLEPEEKKKEEKQTDLVKQHIPEERDPLISQSGRFWDLKNCGYVGWGLDRIVRAKSSIPSSHSYQRVSIYSKSRGSSTSLVTSPGLYYCPREKAFSYWATWTSQSWCALFPLWYYVGPVVFSVVLKVLVATEWRSLPCWSK